MKTILTTTALAAATGLALGTVQPAFSEEVDAAKGAGTAITGAQETGLVGDAGAEAETETRQAEGASDEAPMGTRDNVSAQDTSLVAGEEVESDTNADPIVDQADDPSAQETSIGVD